MRHASRELRPPDAPGARRMLPGRAGPAAHGRPARQPVARRPAAGGGGPWHTAWPGWQQGGSAPPALQGQEAAAFDDFLEEPLANYLRRGDSLFKPSQPACVVGPRAGVPPPPRADLGWPLQDVPGS